MNRFILITCFALTPVMSLAQDAAQAAATVLITPMLEEIAPGAPGVALTGCVVANATADELAVLATATGPSEEVGTLVSTILARQPTIDCATAALGG